MGALTKAEAKITARKVVNRWCAGAAAVGWIPGSTLVLTPGDFVMARTVAGIFEVSAHDVESALAAIVGSVAGRSAAELLSFIPILGWAVKAGVAAATTKAVGEAVIEHYRELSPLP